MGAASSGLRERTVRWLASAGSVASVFLLLTGSRACIRCRGGTLDNAN